MSRSFTEERVVKQLQRYIVLYVEESDISVDDFCERVGIFESAYDTLMDANDRGDVWSPQWVYRIWDALNLNHPGVAAPDRWVN